MNNDRTITIPGRCHMCKHGWMVTASDGWSFPGCYHPPYKGKWCAEIKDCPKQTEQARIEQEGE